MSFFKTTFLIVLILLCNSSYAFKKPKVLFLSPDPKDSKNEFWTSVFSNLKQAANDLQIDLEIIYTDSHHSFYRKEVKKIAQRKQEDRPDYFVGLPLVQNYEDYILKELSKVGIKVFFVNMAIDKEAREKIGHPRKKYKNWIGHFYPDDYNAGALITEEISKKCGKNKNVIGISGNHLSTGSLLREKAFKEVSKRNNLKLQQVFTGDWKKSVVETMMPHIESRYPDTCGYLVASDSMAEGVLNKAKEKYQVCGIDWTKRALNLIKKEKMLCSAGGHFLEPAFSLVAIFDYHNGIDFKDDIGVTYKTPFYLANRTNIDKILKTFFTKKQINDYKSLSKFYSKKKKYQFDIKF
jgi:ABC-type sugar transport system substrate-binding protein